MDYKPILSPQAVKEFGQFPKQIQDAVADRIEKICESAGKYSHSACFPYLPKGHVSIIQYPIKKDITFVVSIHFRFGQNEETIEIAYFGSYELSAEDRDNFDPFST